MSSKIAEQIALYVLPIVISLVALVLRKITAAITAQTNNTRVRSAVVMLSTLIETLVGNAMQTVVADLRDPSKPGEWSAVAAASVKESVLKDLHVLGRQSIDALKSAGQINPEQLDKLLDRMLEAAVFKLKAGRISSIESIVTSVEG